MDITQLILDDHHEQRRLFAMIEQIDVSNTVGLAAIWKCLAISLEVHAETEEKFSYPALLDVGREAGDRSSIGAETLDGIKDHNETRDAVAAVAKHPAGSNAWLEAVAAADKANSDHMAEEERESLTDFRRHASLQLRHDSAVSLAK
jgi:hypothetical protein